MSGRKLGGGRVLGSGIGLAPPQPAPRAPRAVSPYAPSDASSVSLSTSQASVSPPSSSTPVPEFGPQDLASRISIGGPSSGGVPGAGQRLVCPICEDEMVCCFLACLDGVRVCPGGGGGLNKLWLSVLKAFLWDLLLTRMCVCVCS